MSNDELAAAISYAFTCCEQTYIDGYLTTTTDLGMCALPSCIQKGLMRESIRRRNPERNRAKRGRGHVRTVGPDGTPAQRPLPPHVSMLAALEQVADTDD